MRGAFSLAVGIATFLLFGSACQRVPTCPTGGRVDDRCEVVCPFGAKRSGRLCACDGGTELVNGACVAMSTVNKFCGALGEWRLGECFFKECQEGSARETSDGSCVPQLSVREIAANQEMTADELDAFTCDEGAALITQGGRDLACVPPEALCGRIRARACTKRLRCAAGQVPTLERNGCTSFLRGGEPSIVDVPTWLRGYVGPDGGIGTSEFCSAFALRPALFGLQTSRTSIAIDLRVRLLFRGNETSALALEVDGRDANSKRPLSDGAARWVRDQTASFVEVLRDLHATTASTSAETSVRCAIRTGPRPIARPRPAHSARARATSD